MGVKSSVRAREPGSGFDPTPEHRSRPVTAIRWRSFVGSRSLRLRSEAKTLVSGEGVLLTVIRDPSTVTIANILAVGRHPQARDPAIGTATGNTGLPKEVAYQSGVV